jgi:hypothetical protein
VVCVKKTQLIDRAGKTEKNRINLSDPNYPESLFPLQFSSVQITRSRKHLALSTLNIQGIREKAETQLLTTRAIQWQDYTGLKHPHAVRPRHTEKQRHSKKDQHKNRPVRVPTMKGFAFLLFSFLNYPKKFLSV